MTTIRGVPLRSLRPPRFKQPPAVYLHNHAQVRFFRRRRGVVPHP
jgi:hypothetical protein